jgi:putative ABC transport system ATP-binding protein
MLRTIGERRERRKRAMRSLKIVGLGAWAHHRPWELSGGEQQKVAIAQALVKLPDLILADEATDELDSITRRGITTMVRYFVARGGITVIVATHDPLVEEYADVVYEMDDGQVNVVRNPIPSDGG